MTPKEKAIEILEKLIPHVYNEYDGSDGGRDYNAKRHTIQTALILVDEVLRTMDEEDNYVMYKYWKEVKQEIENL